MFTMQRIDERSLVKAEKPELVLLDTPELNAETPAHLLDDDITPTARLFARNTGAMPALGPAEIAGWTLQHRRLRADAARLDDRRAEAGIRDRHRDRRDRMRRQRPRLLPAAGRHGAVAARRGRLRALDRRAARRSAATMRTAAAGGLYRPPQPGRLSRRLGTGDLARLADRQGAGAGNAGGLRAQRRAPARAARRAAAAGRARLSRRVVPEMADARRGARPRARRRTDDATATTGCRARRCATASRSITRSSRSSPTCR